MKNTESRVAFSGDDWDRYINPERDLIKKLDSLIERDPSEKAIKALDDLLIKARNINLERDPLVYLDLEIKVQEILSRRDAHPDFFDEYSNFFEEMKFTKEDFIEVENELIYTYNKLKPYVDDPGLKARKKRNKKLIILVIIIAWLGTNLIVHLFSD